MLDGRNAIAATDITHCDTFHKIHKRTQVKQTKPSLVLMQTRHYEIRTPAAEDCAIAAPFSGPLGGEGGGVNEKTVCIEIRSFVAENLANA